MSSQSSSIKSIIFALSANLGISIAKPVAAADELITNINRCEQALKEHIPDIRWVFFEPDFEK